MPPLSPPDIQDLRGSVSPLARTPAEYYAGVAFICYLPADDAFVLHAYGSAQAIHKDPALLAECLRSERAEPGFIRRILDPTADCTVALLDPAGRQRAEAIRSQQAQRARQIAADADERRLARVRVLDPSKLSLDDF